MVYIYIYTYMRAYCAMTYDIRILSKQVQPSTFKQTLS